MRAPNSTGYIKEIGGMTKKLTDIGLEAILIGGMALVILGSRRVTRDFDFVMAKPKNELKTMIAVFYDAGLDWCHVSMSTATLWRRLTTGV